MDSPKLIAVVGLGGALAVAGMALVGSGLASLLAAAMPAMSLGGWLVFIGVMSLVVGLFIVERGSAQTVEKVESELSLPKVIGNFPWWSAALGGFIVVILYAAFRRSRDAQIAVEPTDRPATGSNQASAASATTNSRRTLSDLVTPIADAAASNAVSLGLAAFGIPSVYQLVNLIGKQMNAGVSSEQSATSQQTQQNGHNREASFDFISRMIGNSLGRS